MTFRCHVLDYTGQELVIQLSPTGQPRRYPADQVLAVETLKSSQHQLADRLYQQHRVAEAQQAYSEALRSEPRAWVRREILAMLVRCALWQGDYATAGSRFLLLVQSDPFTPYYGVIPLVWDEASADTSSAQGLARVWLRHPTDVGLLLGASVLLDAPDGRARALATLQKLSSSTDSRVRALARVQLWRRRLKQGDLGRLELSQWERDAETLPDRVRGGAYFLVGRGHEQRNEFDLAATYYLWVPLVYDDDPRLAADALLRAARCLKRINRTAEAERLFRELTDRFPETEFAKQAASELKHAQRVERVRPTADGTDR